MALKFETEDKAHKGALVTPGERLYLTGDKKTLVRDGDTRAAFLYCTEDQEVSRSEYEKLKLARKKAETK